MFADYKRGMFIVGRAGHAGTCRAPSLGGKYHDQQTQETNQVSWPRFRTIDGWPGVGGQVGFLKHK